jgi:NAD(P)-dependent dehydrogenase (short-subunit alcohol dehydrogenase family)
MTDTHRFTGLRVLVTGAAGGIGAAAARGFRDEGATVVISDVVVPEAALGVADLRFLPADITDAAAVDAMVTEAADGGGIDVLVHAAARLGGSGPFASVPLATFQAYLAVNVTGTWNVAQAVAKVMIAAGTRGSIITFGSVNSLAAQPDSAPYVCSKGAVRLLTRAMAVDLAAHGIRVNTVLPGPVTVPRNAAVSATEPMRAMFARAVPLGRSAQPDELMPALSYLADPRNSFVTGTDVVVDGGLLALIPLD